MMRRKSPKKMSIPEKMIAMTEHNNGALLFMLELASSKHPDRFRIIELLDLLEIRGADIYTLWNDDCQRDMNVLLKKLLNLNSNRDS